MRSKFKGSCCRYERAISDIDLALRFNCASQPAYRLLEVKAYCLWSTNEPDQAKAELAKCQESLLNDSGLQGKKLKSAQDRIAKLCADCAKTCSAKELDNPECARRDGMTLASPNPLLESLSASLETRYSPQQGRFVVATQDIRPGDLIAVDNPYAHFLDKSWTKKLCWRCMANLEAPIPCNNCAGVLYCSQHCKSK